MWKIPRNSRHPKGESLSRVPPSSKKRLPGFDNRCVQLSYLLLRVMQVQFSRAQVRLRTSDSILSSIVCISTTRSSFSPFYVSRSSPASIRRKHRISDRRIYYWNETKEALPLLHESVIVRIEANKSHSFYLGILTSSYLEKCFSSPCLDWFSFK